MKLPPESSAPMRKWVRTIGNDFLLPSFYRAACFKTAVYKQTCCLHESASVNHGKREFVRQQNQQPSHPSGVGVLFCPGVRVEWKVHVSLMQLCGIGHYHVMDVLEDHINIKHSIFIISRSIYLILRCLYLHIFRSTPPFLLRAPPATSLRETPSHWTAAMRPRWSSCFCSGPTTTWSLHTIIIWKCKPGPTPAWLNTFHWLTTLHGIKPNSFACSGPQLPLDLGLGWASSPHGSHAVFPTLLKP